MAGQRLSERVVEVLCGRGDRWTVGSGYLIGGTSVLTAAHNVQIGAGILIRFRGGAERPCTVRELDDGRRAFDAVLDLAVLDAGDAPPLAPVRFGRPDRDPAPNTRNIEQCWAFGFPWFREKRNPANPARPLRDNLRLDGYIAVGEGWVDSTLTFKVDATPRPLPVGSALASEWQGISGAVVFAGNLAIGVITEHHVPEGESSLGIVPVCAVDEIDGGEAWWRTLGADPAMLMRLPGLQRTPWSSAVPVRPPTFVDRPAEAASLRAELLDDGNRAPPLAISGMAGAGKSVLAADLARAVLPGPQSEPALSERFADGVAWIHVGRSRSTSAVQRDLASVLGGARAST